MEKIKFSEITNQTETTHDNTIKINGTEVTIKRAISTVDYISFVTSVVNGCFDENGCYHAEYKEILMKYAKIKYLTNIDVSDISADEVNGCFNESVFWDIEDKSSCICATIEEAVKEGIKYRISLQEKPIDRLCNSLSRFLDSLTANSEKLSSEDFKSIAKRLSKISDTEIINSIINKPVEKEKEENG